jgi:hypothetical protein
MSEDDFLQCHPKDAVRDKENFATVSEKVMVDRRMTKSLDHKLLSENKVEI